MTPQQNQHQIMATGMAVPSVDDYIAGFPPKTQSLLRQLRKTIRAAAPKAEEQVSYGIAGYQYHGMLIYFAGFTNHVSVYPAPRTAAPFKKELADYKGGKGTIQLPLDKPLPLDLIKRIVQFRMKANEEKAAAKKSLKIKAEPVRSKKPSEEEQVAAWINKLDNNTRKEIEAVRKIIKAGTTLLSERIKWNAPSYYYSPARLSHSGGDDIVTFGPYKKDKILLVFHHPAVVNVRSPLLEGEYKDRRLVYFKNQAEAAKNKKELARIINVIIKSIDKK